MLIPTSVIKKHLGGKGIWPIIKSSLFGVPLPLCSCGVIPVAMSLRKRGASKGATIAFLLSTPQTGADNIFVVWSLLGTVFMIASPIIAFVTGIIGGIAVDIFNRRESAIPEIESDDNFAENKNRFKTGFKHAFVTLPQDIGGAMLIGLVIAAIISVVVPDDFFADKIGTGIGSMILMMMVGIPLYVCSTASVPIAAAMIAKGLSPGAALVFLMTGPATNAASFIIIWKVLGRRTAIIYILSVAGCALAAGLLLDRFFVNLAAEVQAHYHQMGTSLIEHTSAVILLILLVFSIYRKHISKSCS